MKNGDIPVAPMTDENGMPFDGLPDGPSTIGLTKREAFAMAAMQGMCSDIQMAFSAQDRERFASIAVKHADALLAELEK